MGYRIITDYKVASNPVTKAIARSKIREGLLSNKLRVYSMDHGAPCRSFCLELGMLLATVATAGEMDPAIGKHDTGVRIMRGGLSALANMSTSNKWDTAQAVAIEVALRAAEELNPQIQQKYMLDAWDKLSKE